MKMENLIVIGDLHLKPKEPYYSQFKDFVDWYINSKYNKECNDLLLLGDLTESVDSSTELLSMFVDLFLNKIKNRTIKILQGNHDASIMTSILSLFKPIKNIHIIEEIADLNMEGLSCLLLPFYYVSKNEDKLSKEEFYSNLPQSYYEKDYDYILHHVEDQSEHFSDKFCDLSKLKTKHYLCGHIHTCNIQSGGHYLGAPILNSKNEAGKTPYIAEISYETKQYNLIEVPKFVEYYDVTYPNDLPKKLDTKYGIFTVKESIEKAETINYYSKQASKLGYTFYHNKVISKKIKEQEIFNSEEDSDSSEERSHKEWFKLYCEQSKIKEEPAKICEEIITVNKAQ